MLILSVEKYCQHGQAIIFTQTKAEAQNLDLGRDIPLAHMHGDVTQHQREVALRKFKKGQLRVLVATDVASRGLDIPNVELVILMQPPQDVEVYIHRSGRTARAGKEGTCITFYGNKDSYLLDIISNRCGVVFEDISIPFSDRRGGDNDYRNNGQQHGYDRNGP